MKFLIAGGGTGGHVYPGIAVADELHKRYPLAQIEFAGRRTAVEGTAVPNAGYKLNHINVLGFERFDSFWNKFKTALLLLRGSFDALFLMIRYNPDVVIGSGGFVCGPVLLSAHLLGKPTICLEQNTQPGVTNRILSKFVDGVCTSFDETKKYLSHPDKCFNTGNPVRGSFNDYTRSTARKELGIPEDKIVILSFGGSLGSETINRSVSDLLLHQNDIENTFFIHITGEDNSAAFDDRAKLEKNAIVFTYSNQMPLLINCADIIISRSGATSIAEINFVGRCTIYVPYPFAADDHQTKNAKSIEKEGACFVIKDDELNANILHSTLKKLCDDPDKIKAMSDRSKSLANPNATKDICDHVAELVKKK